MEQWIDQFFDAIIRVPIVTPILFFCISIIGKIIVRSESLKNPKRWREALYVILTNGSQLSLLAVAVVFTTAVVKTKTLYYTKASELYLLMAFFLVGYFVVCGIESAFNDVSNPRFGKLKESFLGLYVPTLIGSFMVWVGIISIRGG